MSSRTRAVLAAATLVVAAVLPVLGAGSAQAATYRYWTYWWGDHTGVTSHTGWKFASVGPSGQNVSDQAVIGWRFATTSAAGTTKPRTSSSYSSLCSDAKPANGDVRVAVVVDFGSSSDWPPHETPPVTGHVYTSCVTVASGSRATVALAAARLSLRQSSDGLVCGIDGFPASECAPIVTSPTPAPSTTATHAPTPKPTASSSSSRPAPATSSAAGAATPTTSASAAASSSSTSLSTNESASAAASALAVTGDSASPGATDPTLPATTVAPVASGPGSGSSSTPWGAVGGVLVVAAVGGAAWWTMRRGGAR